MDNVRTSNTNCSKRLPIIFCLDVSPSMGWPNNQNMTSIGMLNEAVANFIKEIKSSEKLCCAAEIAFVTFSSTVTKVEDIHFMNVREMDVPNFTVEDGGTHTAEAILNSITALQNRMDELSDLEIPYYAPFLVLVTDGNPDDNDNEILHRKAVEILKKHVDYNDTKTDVIIPFIISVGDFDSKSLKEYSAGFSKGYFPINGKSDSVHLYFGKVFDLIEKSATLSVIIGDKKERIETISVSMDEAIDDLINREIGS